MEILEILEICESGEVWKVEILEIWPSKCQISSRVEICDESAGNVGQGQKSMSVI